MKRIEVARMLRAGASCTSVPGCWNRPGARRVQRWPSLTDVHRLALRPSATQFMAACGPTVAYRRSAAGADGAGCLVIELARASVLRRMP